MSSLGVIEGYLDGSFRPDDTVTRAEMAKMIYVVRTGRSDASAYNDDATTFTDIGDHWARGYIKYCNSLGIIAGHSATRFAPDDTVTTQEAAKMLLVTLGYNADTAGLVGAGWGAKTIALADENGLLEDVVNGTTQGLPRQYAAQLIYNAIFANTVVLRDGEYTNMNLLGTGKNPTIGEKYMDLLSVETTVKEYTDDGAIRFGTLKNTNGQEVSVNFNDYTVDHSDLIGREVRVLYKAATTVNGKATIYGIFEIGDNTYIDTIAGSIEKDDDELTINGTNYDVTNGVTWTDVKSAQPVTVTLNKDGDVYKIEKDADFNFAKITYLGSKSLTANLKTNDTYKSTSFQLEDIDVYDGIAKDDYVVFSKNDYNNKVTLTKADVVTGTVDVVNGNDITIDGTTYTKANDGFEKDLNDLALGTTVKAVVVNGYIYYSEKVSGLASMEDVVYINGTKLDRSYGDDTLTARATFADGTSSEITIGKGDKGSAEEATYKKLSGDSEAHGLYAFDRDGDDYLLTDITVDAGKVAGDFDATNTDKITTAGDDRIGSYRVDNDAVIFVRDGDKKVSVLTGAAVKAWKENTAVSSAKVYMNESNGFNYVELAEIVLAGDVPGASATDVYGYVVATLGQTKEDNKTYVSYSVWTGADTETIKVEKNNNNASIAKGSYVKIDGDDITVYTTYAAVSAYDAGDNTVTFYGVAGEYNITDDTKVIYVASDAKNPAGAEGGSIQTATDHNHVGQYEYNVVYVVDTDDDAKDGTDLLAIFVDVNNEIAGEGYATK